MSERKIKFSVIIPVYNASGGLIKTLDVDEINFRLSRKFADITQIVKYIFRNFVKKLTIDMSWVTGPIGVIPLSLDSRYKEGMI